MVVREWITATIEEVKEQFGRYFALQEIVDRDGSAGEPMPVNRLITATVRDPRKDAAVPMVPDALLRLGPTGYAVAAGGVDAGLAADSGRGRREPGAGGTDQDGSWLTTRSG